ncbi:MAG: hypothetical protein HC854_07615, partial [Flavobacterium sp.]|nr:hypothetical protein [Flavobacterium sp.]
MKTLLKILLLFLSLSAFSQDDIASKFDKKEVYVPMRDGTKLFTAIYTPKDISK